MQYEFTWTKQRGNELIKSVVDQINRRTKTKIPTLDMKDRLISAINTYGHALRLAHDAQSKASIHKNLTKAHELMSQMKGLEPEIKLYHFDRMIKEASHALQIGVGKMRGEWVCEFVQRGKSWDLLLEALLKNQTSQVRSDHYQRFYFKANKENVVFLQRIAFRLSQSFFKESTKLTEAKKFKEAYSLINKALQYLNCSHEFCEKGKEKYSSLTDFSVEMLVQEPDFQESLKKQKGVIEAHLEFAAAKNFFNTAQSTIEPEDMMELFGLAIDACNLAGKLAYTHKDTELEAISEAELGKIYYKGLKNTRKARFHLYDCMLLSNTLYPKNVTEQTWYKVASKSLQEIRDKEAKEEVDRNQKESAEDMAKIKSQLDSSRQKFSQGPRAFLQHLTETLVNGSGLTVDDENCQYAKIKKTILKFIAVTHPDKQAGKARHIQLLFTEITKMLNQLYERYKGL